MKISIYGAGYVGLVTGICLAELGNDVLIMDVNEKKITSLQKGELPIYEQGLHALLIKNKEKICFSTKLEAAVKFGLYQIIAVNTPEGKNGEADLSSVCAVIDGLADHLHDFRIIMIKSTVPVGSAASFKKRLHRQLSERGREVDFSIVSNPEFLRQGNAVKDFMQPERIIVGVEDERTLENIRDLYQPLDPKHRLLIFMDLISSELTKYVANAFLATKISFINEMSGIAEKFGADITKIREGIARDYRIGHHFLDAGCGYGGSCFPKDIKALVNMAREAGCETRLLNAVEKINEEQKNVLFHKIAQYFNNDLRNRTVAVWGLAFKPETDDMREASSIPFIFNLLQAGAKVQAYDPVASHNARRIFKGAINLNICTSQEDALDHADILAIVTEWETFKHPDFSKIREKLAYPAIFDGRNIYCGKTLSDHGLHYYGIGCGETL